MLIKEFFSEYISDISNSLGKGEMLKLVLNEKARELAVYASFEQVQKYSYVLDFEKAMKNNLEINNNFCVNESKPSGLYSIDLIMKSTHSNRLNCSLFEEKYSKSTV